MMARIKVKSHDFMSSPIKLPNKSRFEKNPKKSLKIALKDNIKHFLLNSSLHGLKYIGDKKLAKMERFVFALSFFLAIGLSAYYINAIYHKWTTTPVIIATSAVPTVITQIPFPAITICNMNQAKKSRVANIKTWILKGPAAALYNPIYFIIFVVVDLSPIIICIGGTLQYTLLQSLCSIDSDIDVEYTGKGGSWQFFRQFILNVSQPCHELLLFCRYGSEILDCSHLFDPILTDEGLCCTFNTIHPKFMYINYNEDDNFDEPDTRNGFHAVDWSPETGYVGNITSPYSPVPGIGIGRNMGLTIILNTSLEEYYCSSTSSVGFKVLLHNPIETPKISEYGLSISAGMETRISITPERQDSSENIRHISINKRMCLFGNEASPTFFRTYTSSNCELECESRLMEAQCGCVLYYMPRNSQDSVICGPKDMSCFQRVKSEINVLLNRSTCDDCLPACYSIYYEPSVTSSALLQNDIRLRRSFGKEFKNSSLDSKNLAVVHFFYMRSTFRASIREELLGFVDFIANSGGILGLFLGFSILSVVEFIYFFSLAPYFVTRRESNGETSSGLVSLNSDLRKDPFTIMSTAKYHSRPMYRGVSNTRLESMMNIRGRVKNTSDNQWPYCE